MYLCDSLQAFHQCWYGGTTGQSQIFYRKHWLLCWIWYWLVVGIFFFTCTWYIVCSPTKALCVPQKSWWGAQALWPARVTALRAPGADYSWPAPPFPACWLSAAACGTVDDGVPGTYGLKYHLRSPSLPQASRSPPAPHPFLLSRSNRRSAGSRRGTERMAKEVSQLFCFCCGAGGVFVFVCLLGCFLLDRWMS